MVLKGIVEGFKHNICWMDRSLLIKKFLFLSLNGDIEEKKHKIVLKYLILLIKLLEYTMIFKSNFHFKVTLLIRDE